MTSNCTQENMDQEPPTDRVCPVDPAASTSRAESTNSQLNPAYPSTEQLTNDFGDEQNFDAYQKLGNELNYSIKTLERTHLSKLNLLAQICHEVEGLRQKRHLQRATVEELQTDIENLVLAKKAAEQKKYNNRKNNLEFLQVEFNAISENYIYIENVVGQIQAFLEKDEGNSMNLLGDMAAEYATQSEMSSGFEMEMEKCCQMYQSRTRDMLEENNLYKESLLEMLRLCKDRSSNKGMLELERQEKLSTLQALDGENQQMNALIMESNQRSEELNKKVAQVSADWKADREIKYDALIRKKSSIDSKRQLVNLRVKALRNDQEKEKSELKERDEVEVQIVAVEAQLDSVAAEVQKLIADASEVQDDGRQALCDDLEASDAPLADILKHLSGEISPQQKELIESLLLANGDANGKELKLTACEENLATIKFQIDMLKQEMDEKSKELEDVKGKSDDLRAKLVLLEDDEKLQELQGKTNKSIEHYTALEKKIASTRDNLKKAESEIEALELEIVGLDNQLAVLVSEEAQTALTLAEDDHRLKDVQRAIEESRREIVEIKNKVESKMKVEDVESEVEQVLSDLEKRKNGNAEEMAQMEEKLEKARCRAQEDVERLRLSFEEAMKPFLLDIAETEKNISKMEEELNSDANRLFATTQMTIDMIKGRLLLVEKLIEEFGRLESRARIKKEMSRSLQVMVKIKEHLATTFHGINTCLDKPPFVDTPSYAIYRRRLDIFQRRSKEFGSASNTRFSDPKYQQDLAEWAYNFFGIQSFSGFGSELFSSPDFDIY